MDSKKPLETKRKTSKPATSVKTPQRPDTRPKEKKLSGGALLSIVLIILIAGAGAAVYFNLGGTKDAVASALGMTTIEATEQEKSEQETAKQEEFDTQESEIKTDKEALKQREDELDTRESELNSRESELIKRETAVVEADNEAVQKEQAEKELAAAAEIFAAMDEKSAAEAIEKTDSVEYMVKILISMPSEKAALIMEKMDSDLASEILSEMMR